MPSLRTARAPSPRQRRLHRLAAGQSGLTLLELMVALVLGLVVTFSVIGLYLSSRQAFRTTENLARMQENGRFAFEMLMRDIREAGQVPCGTRIMANALQSSNAAVATQWWADIDAGMLRGVDGSQINAAIPVGTSNADRIADTDAIVVLRPATDENLVRTVVAHDPSVPNLELASVGGFLSNNIALLCDGKSSALLQIGTVSAANNTIAYNGNAPNCSASLGSLGPQCASPQSKTFDAGAVLARWDPSIWFVGQNPRKSRSLYRMGFEGNALIRQEMVPGVHDLQFEYLTRDNTTSQLSLSWVSASNVTGGWNNPTAVVVAVRVTLTLRSEENAAASDQPLERRWIAVVALRNRDL